MIGPPETSLVHYIEDSIEENAPQDSQDKNCATKTEKLKDTLNNSSFLTDDNKLRIKTPTSTIKNETFFQETPETESEKSSVIENESHSKETGENKLSVTPTRKKLSLGILRRTVISDSESPSPKKSSPIKSLLLKKKVSPESMSPRKDLLPRKNWQGPDFKVDVKPIGIDKEILNWLQSIKNNPIITATPVSFS